MEKLVLGTPTSGCDTYV